MENNLNWSYLVFVLLLIIVEFVDIRLLLDALDIMKGMRKPTGIDPEDKVILSHRLWQILICTVAIVGGILVIVFFVLRHL